MIEKVLYTICLGFWVLLYILVGMFGHDWVTYVFGFLIIIIATFEYYWESSTI